MSLTKEKDKKRGRMGASLAKMLGLEDGPAQKALLERKRKNRAKILKLEANYLQGSNPSLCHRLGRGGPPNKANHEIHSALTDGFSVRLTYTTEYNLDDYIRPLDRLLELRDKTREKNFEKEVGQTQGKKGGVRKTREEGDPVGEGGGQADSARVAGPWQDLYEWRSGQLRDHPLNHPIFLAFDMGRRHLGWPAYDNSLTCDRLDLQKDSIPPPPFPPHAAIGKLLA